MWIQSPSVHSSFPVLDCLEGKKWHGSCSRKASELRFWTSPCFRKPLRGKLCLRLVFNEMRFSNTGLSAPATGRHSGDLVKTFAVGLPKRNRWHGQVLWAQIRRAWAMNASRIILGTQYPGKKGRLPGFDPGAFSFCSDQSRVELGLPACGPVSPLPSNSPSFLGLHTPFDVFSYTFPPPSLHLFLSVPIKPVWNRFKKLVVPGISK